jgi:hypothetical protein
MVLASVALPAAALAVYPAPSAWSAAHIDLPVQSIAGAPGQDSANVASLSEITSAEPAWWPDGNASTFASGAPSAAAQTDVWALVAEPAAWAYLMAGFGLAGATLRARRPLSTAKAQARIRGRL